MTRVTVRSRPRRRRAVTVRRRRTGGVAPAASSARTADSVTVAVGIGGGALGNSTWVFWTAIARRMPWPAARAARGSLVATMRRIDESSIAVGTALAATKARAVDPDGSVVRASAGAIVTSADAAVSGAIIRSRRCDDARSASSAPWRSRSGAVDVAGLAPGLVDERLLVVADHGGAEPGRDPTTRIQVELRATSRPRRRPIRTRCCRRSAGRPPVARRRPSARARRSAWWPRRRRRWGSTPRSRRPGGGRRATGPADRRRRR